MVGRIVTIDFADHEDIYMCRRCRTHIARASSPNFLQYWDMHDIQPWPVVLNAIAQNLDEGVADPPPTGSGPTFASVYCKWCHIFLGLRIVNFVGWRETTFTALMTNSYILRVGEIERRMPRNPNA